MNVRTDGTDGFVKDVLEALLGEGRALDVLDGAELPGQPLALLAGDRPLLLPLELLEHLGVVPEIDLRADDEARDAGTVVVDLGEPLLLHVLK